MQKNPQKNGTVNEKETDKWWKIKWEKKKNEIEIQQKKRRITKQLNANFRTVEMENYWRYIKWK